MSNATGPNGVTAPQTPTGIKVIQLSDFYQQAGILHPITVGTISIFLLFAYLRLSSNRCVAPVTLFDWILNVALGSTIAGIVNGTSLVRGLLALITLLAFQFISSHFSSHFGQRLEHAINADPLIIAFRGRSLDAVMRKHRVSRSDLNGALRLAGIWNISEIEAVFIEPTGHFSIYKRKDRPVGMEASVLCDVPGYRRLIEHFDVKEKEAVKSLAPGSKDGTLESGRLGTAEEVGKAREAANDIAADAA